MYSYAYQDTRSRVVRPSWGARDTVYMCDLHDWWTFSLSRNFPDLEIHDHNTWLKISREILLHVLTWDECLGIKSSICGHHVYRSVWPPVIDEVLVCERERYNPRYPQLRHKIKMASNSVETFYRVVLGEMVFSYDNVYILQQGGRWDIHTYLQDKCAQFCVHTDRSGFAWLDYFASSHHAN